MISKNELLALRFAALVREDESLGPATEALAHLIAMLYGRLVSAHGWEPVDALMAVMQLMEGSRQAMVEQAFPDSYE